MRSPPTTSPVSPLAFSVVNSCGIHFIFNFYGFPVLLLPAYQSFLPPVASCGVYESIVLPFILIRSLFSIGNFKAVYQRARAHAALYNEDEARRDFDTVEKLDQKFKPFVQQELRKLGQSMRSMHASQNKTYWDTTQEKWGPGGTKPTSAARKKNVKFPPKATEGKAKADINVDKKTEDTKSQEMESSEKCTPVETEGVDGAETGKNPDVKAEQGNKEPERGRASGEGLDNESIEKAVVHEAGLGVPDNQAIDKDRDPAPASSGKDNAASKRSVRDKARKKVKCQSSAAPQPKRTNSGNKANRAKTEKGGTASE